MVYLYKNTIYVSQINDPIEYCRCPDPAVRHQLVKCCVISLSGWLMQETTQERTIYSGSGRGAVRPARGCARALYYLAPDVPVVGIQTRRESEGSSQVSARGEVD